MNSQPDRTEFWKRKLAAYLHDPPSKALDIKTHGERSEQAFRAAGFTGDEVGEYFKHADHTGAAIDRIPFPKSIAAGIQCAFDGVRNAFLHPLGDGHGKCSLKQSFHKEFASADVAIEGEQTIQPVLTAESLNKLPTETDRWRARFFAHWRLWRPFAVEKDYRLGLLPADTRIPDHSIWTHMQVVSALAGCVHDNKWEPAFLKFQLGPVQEFIAAARSIRDLWSGSYLLAWLMAAGLKKLSEEVGPDNVIYPNLQGQPLFDLRWRDELWNKVTIGSNSVWAQSLKRTTEELLVPNLPNVFLAVVPAQRGAELGQAVAEAIRTEWKRIADSVWQACQAAGLTKDEGRFTEAQRKARFDQQVGQFLSLSWQVTPWPATLNEARQMAQRFAEAMPIGEARQRVEKIVEMATKLMPVEHRDGRFYAGGDQGPKQELNNVGLGWSVILALNGWQLDAVRQVRLFDAANPGQWQVGAFCNKDSLTGREEAVAGGRKWSETASALGSPWAKLFKHDDWLGAASLIKRVWHLAYLIKEKWGLKTDGEHFPMPSTYGIAKHEPFSNADEEQDVEEMSASEKYFAVLALDGDEIGQWISGKKTPPFKTQLADYYDHDQKARQGMLEYFERQSNPDGGKQTLEDRFAKFLTTNRPLSASYHLQFSEAISNFAQHCARPIVEAFDGRVIYAGGDDVVALLPADTALACAQCLRRTFTGSPAVGAFLAEHARQLHQRHQQEKTSGRTAQNSPYYQKLAAENCLLQCDSPGFVCRLDEVDQNDKPIPFLVPGPAADCSVGIAIAHFKAPLQDVVRAAQAAEKRAKHQLGRSAVAVTLMKRSGEIIEWGCQWESGGLELYRLMAEALENGRVSAKFPHRLAELLTPYLTASTPLARANGSVAAVEDFDPAKVIPEELAHAVDRQSPLKGNDKKALVRDFSAALDTYLKQLDERFVAQTQRFDERLAKHQAKESERPVRADFFVNAVIGLCQTVAFAHRTQADDKP